MLKLLPLLTESIMDSPEVQNAIEFAKVAHGVQKRKYTAEPYIVHPIEVAEILARRGHPLEVIIAAILHDVVEDTKFTLDQIRKKFGDKVASLVDMVTDISKVEDGNRKVRKEKDLQHLAGASDQGKSIKLADLISNSQSITAHDPKFAKVYMREKKNLLAVLHGGDSALYKQASDIVDNYYKTHPDD